jgi:hypothetical protein
MNRFLLFAGDHYYPLGGWDDLIGDFAALEEALAAPREGRDWWHVIDTNDGSTAASGTDR